VGIYDSLGTRDEAGLKSMDRGAPQEVAGALDRKKWEMEAPIRMN
jgi:hypothetical protein